MSLVFVLMVHVLTTDLDSCPVRRYANTRCLADVQLMYEYNKFGILLQE
jgi:hypothetical protein